MTANKATPEELDRLATECADKLDAVPECCGEFVHGGYDDPPECCGNYFPRMATYDETKELIRQAIDQALALAAADLIESLVQKKQEPDAH
jgi:hypothetical protein